MYWADLSFGIKSISLPLRQFPSALAHWVELIADRARSPSLRIVFMLASSALLLARSRTYSGKEGRRAYRVTSVLALRAGEGREYCDQNEWLTVIRAYPPHLISACK
ncbi:unnamed protein product (mitochondrion) [Musa textilis]